MDKTGRSIKRKPKRRKSSDPSANSRPETATAESSDPSDRDDGRPAAAPVADVSTKPPTKRAAVPPRTPVSKTPPAPRKYSGQESTGRRRAGFKQTGPSYAPIEGGTDTTKGSLHVPLELAQTTMLRRTKSSEGLRASRASVSRRGGRGGPTTLRAGPAKQRMRLQRPSTTSSGGSGHHAVTMQEQQEPSGAAPLKEWEADEAELMRWTTAARARDVEESRRRLAAREARASQTYEPFAHRQRAVISNWAAFMHLVNGILGIGLFMLPFQMHMAGIALGIVFLSTLSILSCYCCYMTLRNEYAICRDVREPWLGLPRSVEHAWKHGPRFLRATAPACRYVTYFLLLLRSIFITSGYCHMIALLLSSSLRPYIGDVDDRIYKLTLIPFFAGLCIFPDMKTLMVVSVSANLFTIAGVMMLLYAVLTDEVDREAPATISDTDFWRFPLFLCGALYAVNNVPLVHCIEKYMRMPSSMLSFCGVLQRSMFIITILLLAVAVSGYASYGVGINRILIHNLGSSTVIEATEWIFVVGFYLSYPINIFVLFDTIWEALLKNLLRGYPTGMQDGIGILLRISLVLLSTTVAAALPNYSFIDGLANALAVPFLVMGFPAVVEMCICWEMREFGRFNYILFKDMLLMVIAIYCCIFGIFQTFQIYPFHA